MLLRDVCYHGYSVPRVLFPASCSLIDQLESDSRLTGNKSARQGMDELKLLLKYCTLYNIQDRVRDYRLLKYSR